MPGSNTNQRKLNRGGLTHVPSPPWHGAVIAAVLLLSMATLFSYALLDWQWQQDRGHWNYTVAIGALLLFALVLRRWRNDPRRLFGTAAPSSVTSAAQSGQPGRTVSHQRQTIEGTSSAC